MSKTSTNQNFNELDTTPRAIARALVDGKSQKEVAQSIGMSQGFVSDRVQDLRDEGVIESCQNGRESVYWFKENYKPLNLEKPIKESLNEVNDRLNDSSKNKTDFNWYKRAKGILEENGETSYINLGAELAKDYNREEFGLDNIGDTNHKREGPLEMAGEFLDEEFKEEDDVEYSEIDDSFRLIGHI